MKIIKNNKGMVLIISYFVLVVLLGLSAVSFLRSINNSRQALRTSNSLEAFYEAEAGIAYVYAEAARQGFEWYTHLDRNNVGPAPVTLMPNTSIDGTGCYTVAGRAFKVKAYPEVDTFGAPTGITIILSQATVNNITRTIEYRLGQESAYQYFFFYPQTTTFGSDTYDGRNYGGIHVNGNIYLTGTPYFNFLTELSCGWNTTELGYIERPRHDKFADLHGELDYPTSVSSPTNLPSYMYLTATYQYYTGNTYFKTGCVDNPNSTISLNYYLSGFEAAYDFDRYDGNGTNTTPAHYVISDDDLKNLAIYEMGGTALWGKTGSVPLLNTSSSITISNPNIGTGTEKEIFKKMYDHPGEAEGHWNEFWTQWKTNHANDYQQYHANGTLTGGQDWERRFLWAAYNWGDTSGSNGVPDGMNREWWEDLSYGDDRGGLLNDQAPAQVESYYTGAKLELYFLNTKYQDAAWADWLNANGLNQAGKNKTLVQDITQGGEYLDPGIIIKDEQYATQDKLKQKALNGGLYIGGTETQAYLDWCAQVNALWNQQNQIYNTIWQEAYPYYQQYINKKISYQEYREIYYQIYAKYQAQFDAINQQRKVLNANIPERYQWVDPRVEDCIVETQFYNAQQPAGYYYNYSWDKYQPSNVLVIDVHELKQVIAKSIPDFNGVVYVDLSKHKWSYTNYDSNAIGVMLVNGESLPEEGLSLVTPHNVYIKGNYNLDPDGCSEKNRTADLQSVIDRVTGEAHYSRIDGSAYSLSEAELQWHPAEIITKRAVYTLSEDFNEPLYMPMAFDHAQQYYEECDHVLGQDFVNGDPTYPTDGWVPDPSSTRASSTNVNLWFKYYNGGQTTPSQWTKAWIDANWPSNESFPLDTNGDGVADKYILSDDLRSDVDTHIETVYDNTFAYNTIYGPEGSGLNATTPAKYNQVNETHIYNTAIVTPYSTSLYELEYWGSTDRIINGAFIQLPDKSTYKSSIPLAARYARTDAPDNFFRYETRFGKDAISKDKPAAGLMFGADSSWREIDNANF